ncbi:hypothetical protein ZEAMMB73_Zm00001d047326 [Zea mays]|uniref:Uncharacterized protein n=1 Tax=Zea mays TaxID=4577 RepID=A0A1D6P8N5_MAIZE|nr:hypothetical protein ZEAMMB73_Zm00001d047326 [Zea mays]
MAHDHPFSLRLPVHASDHLEGSWLLPLSHLQIYASTPFAPAGSAKTHGLSRDHPTCSCPPPPPCRVPLRSSSHSLTRVPHNVVVNSQAVDLPAPANDEVARRDRTGLMPPPPESSTHPPTVE